MSKTVSNPRASSEETYIAEQFVRARLDARTLAQYPGTVPADLAAAYRCQEEALARWPEPIGGWKVTERLPPAMKAQYGAERLIGPVFVPNIRSAPRGESVDCQVFVEGFAAVEPELLVRVSRDAPADKEEWTVEEAAELVGDLCLGIEIASSPLATLLQLGVTAVASDFGANFGIVVGDAIPGWRTLEQITARCEIEGECVGRGATSVRGGALAAFTFVLGQTARRRRPLRAGAVVTTGTITKFHPIRPGQRARLVFEGIGEVCCRAVQAQPRVSRS